MMKGIATISEVAALEREHGEMLPSSTYEMSGIRAKRTRRADRFWPTGATQ